MEKVVKTRKEHNCYRCNKNIPVGSLANFYKLKQPKFNTDGDSQIGIEYNSFYICKDYDCLDLMTREK